MDVLYLCNRLKCNKQDCLSTTCMHTLNVDYAKNGSIKGPIDLIKRFRIHLRPHFYLEEKL